MKYLKKDNLNPATGDLERVVAEGCAGQRPWVALDCIKFNNNVIASSSQLLYGGSSCEIKRVIRVRCTDLGLESYLALLVENWLKFYNELADKKDPAGRPYNLVFNTYPYALWDGECEKTGEFYVDFCADGISKADYDKAVEDFLLEMSPIFIRMAAIGPKVFTIKSEDAST